MTDQEVEVTQADRDAAADFWEGARYYTWADCQASWMSLVQTLARHRSAATADLTARIAEMEAENARLREALGAHVQADAYRDTFPDSGEDAKYLRKQETWWRLQARNSTGSRLRDECADAAKARAMELPETKAALAKIDALKGTQS